MVLIKKILSSFLTPPARYKAGDHVQTHKDGPLMIVQWSKVDKKSKSTILYCKWFDSETKSNRANLFSEHDVLPFDWYNP
jgi:uncharacterized protein YodC (DUF2158 family)